LMKGESVCSMKVTSPEKQGQTTVLLRSLSPGKPNRLNVVCPRFTPGRAPPQIGLFDVT